MQPEFWHKKWASNQIGFHLPEVNPYLQRHWPELRSRQTARVLVPLCGKSLDLAWLAGRGHQVLGVELSEKAIEDFFSEHQIEPQISEQGRVQGLSGELHRVVVRRFLCADGRAMWPIARRCTTAPR